VHEGGYAVEDDRAGGLRFRNRHGVVCRTQPSRPPPASVDEVRADHHRLGLGIGPRTNRNGDGDPLDLALAVIAIANAVGWEREVGEHRSDTPEYRDLPDEESREPDLPGAHGAASTVGCEIAAAKS
jgi:hypothetical protein